MKTCMHNQMHRYVCDTKCMNDFYNPLKKQISQTTKAMISNPAIVRYDPAQVLTDRWEMGSMSESDSGDYVKLEDHQARIAELERDAARLVEALCEIEGLSTALRPGGPDPMDLEGLYGALEKAFDLAQDALIGYPEQKP